MYETRIEFAEDLVTRFLVAAKEVRDMPVVFLKVRQLFLRCCSACIDTAGHCFKRLL